MSGLPLLKLAGLLVKQIAKPLSNRLKQQANKNERTNESLISFGQLLHRLSSRLTVFVSGYRFLGVKPLPNEEALSKAVVFISESVVFTLAGLIIVIEYNRSENKNIEKNKKLADKEIKEKLLLEQKFVMIHERLDDIEKSLPNNSKIILDKRKSSRANGLEPVEEYTDNISNNINKDSQSITWRYIWPFNK